MRALAKLLAFVGVVAAAAIMAWTTLGRNAPEIVLSDAVIQPIEGGAELGLFLKITNEGEANRLIRADLGDLGTATLNGPGDFAIPVGAAPTLAPDGAHIRLGPLAEPLKVDQLVPVTLHFETGGTVATRARVADPLAVGDAAEAGLFGLGGICQVEDGEPAPALGLSVQPEGDGWRVTVETEEFSFVQAPADAAHVPGEGHGHLYLDGVKLQRLYGAEATIGALPAGAYELRVTLNTNDHRAYVVGDDPVTAVVKIRSDG